MVFVVRNRKDLLERVIPFFESHPLISEKRFEFQSFAKVVRAMEAKEHFRREGFERLLVIAARMNGGGKYRKEDWLSRILRGHTPDMEMSMKIWSDPHGDVGSQAEQKRSWPS